jgi:hypothetical protein
MESSGRSEKKSKVEDEGDGRSGGKKNGKVALAAARRMAETASDVFAHLEARGKTRETILMEMEERDCILLAQVTKNPGGGKLKVKLRDGSEPDPVRICRPLQVKGRAAPKQFSNIMRIGDVVVIVKGDIEGKFTAAQAQRAEKAFDRLSISYPRGFFTVEAAGDGEDGDPAFVFDRSAEAEAEARADDARQLEEARAWAVFNGTEVPLTVADIARVKAEYDAKRLAAAAAAASAGGGPKAAKARGGAGGPAEDEDLEAAVVAKKGLVGFAALAAATKGKKGGGDEEFSFE